MTLPQLAEAYDGLSRLEKEYENMSGVCATLKGLVLLEAKGKRELKGRFKSWIIKTFPKSYKTATRYMRLAEAFSKSDSTGTFASLAHDLAASVAALQEFSLDLKHPVVAKVAEWVNGRGAYQLMLDFPTGRGGDTSGSRKKLTPAGEHAKFLEDAKTEFAGTFESMDRMVEAGTWKAPSITDPMLDAALEVAREFAKQASAWRKLTKKERSNLTAEDAEGAEE